MALLLDRDDVVLENVRQVHGVVMDVHSVAGRNAAAASQLGEQVRDSIGRLGRRAHAALGEQADTLAYVALLLAAVSTLSTDKMVYAQKMDRCTKKKKHQRKVILTTVCFLL